MAEDGHASGADQPEDCGDGRGPETQRDTNAQQRGVELRGVEATETDIQIATVELANPVQTGSHEDDDKQKERVGQQAVDAEHDEDDGIVAGEVGQVVVDTTLDLTEVGGLGDALDVEEFGDGAQVGKSRAQGLGADVVETIAEARGDRVNGNGDGHGDW